MCIVSKIEFVPSVVGRKLGSPSRLFSSEGEDRIYTLLKGSQEDVE
jgi:hypothetical protein